MLMSPLHFLFGCDLTIEKCVFLSLSVLVRETEREREREGEGEGGREGRKVIR